MCGVARTWGQTARTKPTTATMRKSAGSSRRARPAQKRLSLIVPVVPHSFTSRDVMRKPESTKNESTP